MRRAFAKMGPLSEAEAEAALARLDALVDEGEPIVSVLRDGPDDPWTLDVLFVASAEEARTRWLREARVLCPALGAFRDDPLAERDWVAESQRALHPVRAGRFLVHGSHDRTSGPPSRWRIEIDAGRAFGTAHHASTKGCLLALEALAKRAPLTTVADVGTGSGVLAIAADRLGARAYASDVDPEAVVVACQNVRANGVYRPVRPVVAAGPVTGAEVVVANILARPLVAMATPLAASTGRTLILSGLRSRDVRRVEATYRARGFVRHARVLLEDWATLTLVRPGRACGPGKSGQRVATAGMYRRATSARW